VIWQPPVIWRPGHCVLLAPPPFVTILMTHVRAGSRNTSCPQGTVVIFGLNICSN